MVQRTAYRRKFEIPPAGPASFPSSQHGAAAGHAAPPALQRAHKLANFAVLRSAPTSPPGAQGIIQRTRWTYDAINSTWVQGSSSSTDTDPHPDPNSGTANLKKNPSHGDVYDQNTGQHKSPIRRALAIAGRSSGALSFYDRRARTGYAYASGKNRQGPHTVAHIAKRVALYAAVRAGRRISNLIDSPALPRPRRMNRMLRARLETRGPNWKTKTRKLRTKYIRAYRRLYFTAKNHPSKAKRLDAMRRAMELNPATVYNIGSGKTSASQIAGKGENRRAAARDWRKVMKHLNTPASSLGLATMDTSGATSRERREANRSARSLGQLLHRNEVSEDSGSSESDSEIDDLDEE